MPFEVQVERTFNATHALTMPDGVTEPVHGHDWRVVVTLGADRLDEHDLLVDFHALEAALDGAVGPLQHRHLNDLDAFAERNPSAERLAEHIAGSLAAALPAGARLTAVAVTEAPGCVAVYRPE